MLKQVAGVQVVVFGASEGGRRALERLQANHAEVVAFADNARDRQGTTFRGIRVLAPSDLQSVAYDRIVVASHGWKQIVPQLRELGIAAERIEVYRLGDDSFQSLPPVHPTAPRLLLLTDDCIALSHGTGALLMRQFADYPKEQLLHGYLWQRGEAALPHSYRVAPGVGPAITGGDDPLNAQQLVAHLTAQHGSIDAVYSNFYGDTGLAFLKELAEALPSSVPIVHHALDFLVRDEATFDALLRDLAPRLARIWAIGPSLAARLANVTGTMVTVVNPFSSQVTPTWKTDHRELSPDFRAVVVGNVYTPSLFLKVKEVWGEVRRRHGVGPIKWFAHPTTVANFEKSGVSVAPDIEYCGFAVDGFLHEQLCAADIAIMPFNVSDEPDDPIARYSVPSRLSEYMNAGVPVFAAAGRGTDAYRFMAGNSVAVCATLDDRERFTVDLFEFMRSTAARRAVGESARRYAVEHGDVVNYRKRLIGELTQLIAAARLQAEPLPSVPGPEVTFDQRLSRMMSDKIHYACGRRVLDGWLNVDMFDDAYPYGPPDDELRDRIYYADLRAPHPFPDNSFQFAYGEDFLEHVTQAESLIFLSEAFRTLKKGGVLRLSTPDFERILRRHLRSGNYDGAVACREEAYTAWHHLHFYSLGTLELVAKQIGFSRVSRCEYGKSQHPVLEQESRPDQADLNLVVELTK